MIGAAGEEVGAAVDVGAATLLAIDSTGRHPHGSCPLTADAPGVQGDIGTPEHFGGRRTALGLAEPLAATLPGRRPPGTFGPSRLARCAYRSLH